MVVCSAGKVKPWKIASADPVIKLAFAMLLSSAFSFANLMESADQQAGELDDFTRFIRVDAHTCDLHASDLLKSLSQRDGK